jgi:hypothetical protein
MVFNKWASHFQGELVTPFFFSQSFVAIHLYSWIFLFMKGQISCYLRLDINDLPIISSRIDHKFAEKAGKGVNTSSANDFLQIYRHTIEVYTWS